MKQLAIKGNKNKQNEIIELITSMGGIWGNSYVFVNDSKLAFYIDKDKKVQFSYTNSLIDTIILTYDEFIKKYPFKIGEKVIDKLDGLEGEICEIKWDSIKETIIYCVAFGYGIDYGYYSVDMIREKYTEDEKVYTKLLLEKDQDDKLATEMSYYGAKFIAPDGFLIGKTTKIDESILIEFVKKKPKYPTSYEECCKILGILTNSKDMTYCGENVSYEYSLSKKMHNIRKLHICRDAFYKIYGEEIGLGTSWKPDWTDSYQKKYTITVYQNEITLSSGPNVNKFLAFPTMEMRNVFYESFKIIIEEVKELL